MFLTLHPSFFGACGLQLGRSATDGSDTTSNDAGQEYMRNIAAGGWFRAVLGVAAMAVLTPAAANSERSRPAPPQASRYPASSA